MVENINVQFRPPFVSYKFFHKTEFQMYAVDMVVYSKFGTAEGVFVQKVRDDNKEIVVAYSIDDGNLIPSTEIYAEDYVELYYGDIVNWKHDGQNLLRMVFWDNGWRVMNCTTEEFSKEAGNMTILGNKFEQEDLYLKYLEHINGKKS